MKVTNTWGYYYKNLYFYTNLCYLFINIKLFGLTKSKNTIYNFFRNNGPLFTKIGQNLVNKKEIDTEIKEILKGLCCENFKENHLYLKHFKEENIIAAGSIAQVWDGVYKDKHVIVKKLHNDIFKDTLTSIHIFQNFKKRHNNNEILNYMNNIVDLYDIYKELLSQLDFTYEVKNMEKFTSIFNNIETVHIPTVYEHTNSYIVESYEHGLHFDDFCKEYPDYASDAAALIQASYYLMVFNNFVHGDFHQSNFLLKVIDDKVHLTILDFGIVSSFETKTLFYNFVVLFRKYIYFPDMNELTEFLISLNMNENANIDKFREKCNKRLEEINFFESIKEMMETDGPMDAGVLDPIKTIQDILDLACKNNLKISSNILNICNGFIQTDEYYCHARGDKIDWKSKIDFAKKYGFIEEYQRSFLNLI